MPVEFKRQLRTAFPGVLIYAGAYTAERAREAIAAGWADLVAFGRPFVANPDLPERLRTGAALTPHDRNTLFGGGERGLTDYPTLAPGRGLNRPTETAHENHAPFPPGFRHRAAGQHVPGHPARRSAGHGRRSVGQRYPLLRRRTAVWRRPRRAAPRRSARGRPRDAYSLGTKVGRLVLDEHEDASQRDLGEKAACSATGCRTGSSTTTPRTARCARSTRA